MEDKEDFCSPTLREYGHEQFVAQIYTVCSKWFLVTLSVNRVISHILEFPQLGGDHHKDELGSRCIHVLVSPHGANPGPLPAAPPEPTDTAPLQPR